MNNFIVIEIDNRIVIKMNDKILTKIICNYNNEKKYQIINEIRNMFFGEDNLKIDFYDFKCLMQKSNGISFIGIGHKRGQNSAYEALSEAVKEISINGVDIKKLKGFLINITSNENYPLVDFDEAFDFILKDFIENEETYILQSEFCDESFADNEIRVTIIATGFESE